MSTSYKVAPVIPPLDITFPTVQPVAPLLPTHPEYSYDSGGNHLINTYQTVATNVPDAIYLVKWTGSTLYRTQYDCCYFHTGLVQMFLSVSPIYGVAGEYGSVNGEMIYRCSGTVQVRAYQLNSTIFFSVSLTKIGEVV
jgi:hypothetical protein